MAGFARLESTSRRTPWGRLRTQLGGAWLVGLLLPPFGLDLLGIPGLDFASTYSTTFAVFAAITIGVLVARSLSVFPGNEAIFAIVPSFMIPFGITLGTLLFFRLDYSRSLLLLGFLGSVGWVLFAEYKRQQTRLLRVGVILPSWHDLPALRQVDWVRLDAPTLPDDIDTVAADLRSDLPDDWERFLADCAISGVPVFHIKSLLESLTGEVQLEHLSENSFGSLLPTSAYLRTKYFLDRAISAVLLILLLPLLAVIAVIIMLDSPGSPFFRQLRIGERGNPFSVAKFRTMRVQEAVADGRSAAMTQSDDDRVTRAGRFLRRTRLDEIPQLWNILKGEMSLIGPRPEVVVLSEWYETEIAFYRYRHIVRPGITGWAQVNQGHVTNLEDVQTKLHLDFYYIKHLSVWLDSLVVVRTAMIMLSGFGAK